MEKNSDKTTIFGHALRFSKFGIVGFSGIFINMGMLYMLREYMGLPYYLSGLFAIELSIITNFILNDLWTWRDRRGMHLVVRFLRYNAAATFTSFGINYPVLLALTYIVGVNYLLANLIGIVVASLLNFVINHHWTYGQDVLKRKWLSRITWVLFVFVVILIILGVTVFVSPGIQRFLIKQALLRLHLPFQFTYSRVDVIDGRIKVRGLEFEMDALSIATDTIIVTPPEMGYKHLDSVYVYGFDLKMKREMGGGNDSEPMKPIKLPVTANGFVLERGNFDLGVVAIEDVYLNASIDQGWIDVDTLSMFVRDRGQINSLKGRLGFTDSAPGLWWKETDIVANRSFLKSYGSLIFSPLNFDFTVASDTFDLAEIDSFLQFYALNGYGDIRMKLKGNPQGVLSMDTDFSGILFGFPFDSTSTVMVWDADVRKLRLDSLIGNVVGADINGDVTFYFADMTYVFDAFASGFDLRGLMPEMDLASDFTGTVRGSGKNFEPELMELKIQADLVEGMFFDIDFDSAVGDIRITMDTLWFEPSLHVYRGGNDITLSGNMAYEGDMQLDAFCRLNNIESIMEIPDMADMAGGRGVADLHLTSTTIDPDIEGTFIADSLFLPIAVADSLYATFYIVDLTSDMTGVVNISGRGSTFDMPFDSFTGSLNIRGDGVGIRSAEMWMDSMYFYMMGDFAILQDSMLLRFDGFKGEISGFDIVLMKPSWMKFLDDTIVAANVPLGLGTGSIVIDTFRFDEKGTRVLGRIEDIRVENILHELGYDPGLRTGVNGTYSFEMVDSLQNAKAALHLRTDEVLTEDARWGKGIVNVSLDSGRLTMDNVRFVHDLEVYLVRGYIEPFADGIPLDLSLQGQGRSTILMQVLSDKIDRFGADIDFKLDVEGSVDNPLLTGNVDISGGNLKLFAIEDTIDNLTLKAQFKDSMITIDSLYAELKSAKKGRKGLIQGLIDFLGSLFGEKNKESGYLFAKGNVSLRNFENPGLDLSVITKSLPVNLSSQGIFLVLNTDLDIKGSATKPDISGTLNIPKGTVVNAVGSSSSGGGSTSTIPADIAIEVSIPDNFWIFLEYPFMWAEIEIEGDIVVETVDGALALQGELSTLKGEVNAYGSKFQIESGQIVFDEGLNLDPTIDITATTNIYSDSLGIRQDPVPIELHITGKASEPQLELSAGTYTNEELILMLTLNQSIGNADFTDVVSDRATEVLKTYGWNQVSKGVQGALGVEEFQITPVQEAGEQEDYRVSVGKYITPKIYLSYSYEGFTGSDNKGDIGDIYVEYQIAPNVKLVGGRGTDRTSQKGIETYKLELDFKWTY